MGLGYGIVGNGGEPRFEKVIKVKSLIPVLEERLPKSCNVYNMAINHQKFQNEMTFYAFEGRRDGVHKDPWILATYLREDYGMDINISAPRDLSHREDFKEALLSAGILEWEAPFIFAATEAQTSPIVQDIVIEGTGKQPFACKNLMFYTTPKSTKLVTQFTVGGSTLELKPLDAFTGAKFLVENWPFAKSGSGAYVRKLLERNPSSGVYVDGKLVSGAAMNGSGMITMLHTLKEHRHKGYAQLCMNFMAQALFKHNLIPCCTVEMTNTASIALQRKIGLQVSHEAFYIAPKK